MLSLPFWFSHLTSASRTLMVFAGVLLVVRIWMSRLRRLGSNPLPPGPLGLPILGYLPFLGKDYHLTLTNLGKKFGSVYQIYLGAKRVVVINDHNLIRHAFKQPVFSGRPDTELTKILQGYGVINSDGARWKEQRSFIHSVLRDFGAKNFGPSRDFLQNNILKQVRGFLTSLRAASGSPYYARTSLARAVSNVVGSILMSVTFEEDDEGFKRLLALFDEGFRLLTLAVPVNFIPSLRHMPGWNHSYAKIVRNKEETAAYFREIAEKHKETMDEETVRDFVDAFYLQQKKAEESNEPTFFSQEQLVQVMGDIFSAGVETVTSTLEWSILFLIRNPDVQARLREELDRVVGQNRTPELEDMPHMPYMEATILEVLRRANVIALGNAHATLDDTELGGYLIPKNTHILPNLWSVHMDPELWENPEEFRPERFLVNGRVVKPSYFMPFSVGRRMCIGDSLTRMEVFLFLSCLLQEFELKVPEGHPLPPVEGIAALSMTAQPFQMCAIPRQST